MSFFNIYNKAKNHINKTYFSEKIVISFEAYNLLKKYVVKGLSDSKSLDTAYPKNLKMNVLSNRICMKIHTNTKFHHASDRNFPSFSIRENDIDQTSIMPFPKTIERPHNRV